MRPAEENVFQQCGVVDQAAGGFDFGVHVGEHPLDGLEVADVFAEGVAIARVFCGFVERALR